MANQLEPEAGIGNERVPDLIPWRRTISRDGSSKWQYEGRKERTGRSSDRQRHDKPPMRLGPGEQTKAPRNQPHQQQDERAVRQDIELLVEPGHELHSRGNDRRPAVRLLGGLH